MASIFTLMRVSQFARAFGSIAALGFAFSPVASAQFLDGNALHSFCTGNPATAHGYAMAVADEVSLNVGKVSLDGQSIIPKKFVCIPEGVMSTQVKDVVCQYLAARPQDRHHSAYVLAYSAMLQAWKCPGP